MAQTTSPEERALWRTFGLMRRQLDLALERRLQADADISTADYEILHSLLEEPTKRLRAGQLADIIGWEKSRVSHQITRMEQRGLVVREECGADARGVWVVLTQSGHDVTVTAAADRTDAIRSAFFDLLTDQEKVLLAEVSGRVLDALGPQICSESVAHTAHGV